MVGLGILGLWGHYNLLQREQKNTKILGKKTSANILSPSVHTEIENIVTLAIKFDCNNINMNEQYKFFLNAIIEHRTLKKLMQQVLHRALVLY